MGYIYIVCMHVCMYVAYAIIFGKLLELANGPIMDSPSRSVPGVRSSNELDEVFLCDVAGCRPPSSGCLLERRNVGYDILDDRTTKKKENKSFACAKMAAVRV